MKRLLICALASLALFVAPAQAQDYYDSAGTHIPAFVPVAPGLGPMGTAGRPMYVQGTFSATLGGFAPGNSYATLTAGTSTGNVALPTGATVVVYNNGSVPAYVHLGASSAVTATTSQDAVPAGGWMAFTVGSNTYLAAITGSSSAPLVLSGGAGLPTGAGGGGSGGGGAVTLNSSPSLANGNGVVPTQGGSVLSATNGGYSNVLQGNAALSATNGLYANILQGNAVLSSGNPIFASITNTPAVTVSGVATAANQEVTAAGTSASSAQGVQGVTGGVAMPVSLAANQSVNVAQVGGLGLSLGQTTKSASVPVALASDQGAITAGSSGAITNPTSTLTLPSATTAYTAGQLIASSATAGSVVVPSFAIANSAGGAMISRLRLSSNDTTSTAWGAQTVQVDLWSAAPTFTNGDRGTWSPATGTANHLGAFSCIMSAEYGDGAYAECAPAVGQLAMPKLASGTAIYWTLDAITGSGVTGASKVWTLTTEEMN